MNNILGMGNALVDILVRLESDRTLEVFSLPKGSMQLVDRNTSRRILAGIDNLDKTITSGGSAANTIHGLAELGIRTGFIGTVGRDRYGDFFRNDMKRHNIHTELFQSSTESGRAISLISPDSERTFATYLGAAIELEPDHITQEQFKGYNLFHMEGYLVQNHDLVRQAFILARRENLKISLDMASYNVVEENIDFLEEMVKNYVDIVFANEEEARSFTGKAPEEALHHFAEMCDIAVVKTGKSGSLVKRGEEFHKIGIIPAESVDTTGAGDLYAAGFLYGLTKNLPLNRCGEMGALLSGRVIEVIGSKVDESQWKLIRDLL
ncbi:MAG: adenosine kinase [Bacteroidales bacterium]|nr:MAG: adenosine kinase [Bacteroidales bacterium]